MKSYKNDNFHIVVVLLIIAIILVIPNVMRYVLPYSGGYFPTLVSDVNRVNAKQIQNALGQYYASYDGYPNKKQLNKCLKIYMGKVPCYKNGKQMIKSYKKIGEESYEVRFNNDTKTDGDESKCVLTPGTDTKQLFMRKVRRYIDKRYISETALWIIIISLFLNLLYGIRSIFFKKEQNLSVKFNIKRRIIITILWSIIIVALINLICALLNVYIGYFYELFYYWVVQVL